MAENQGRIYQCHLCGKSYDLPRKRAEHLRYVHKLKGHKTTDEDPLTKF